MKLKVGADPFPPYQYYDDKGVLQGFDYDLIDSVIDSMGYSAEYYLDDWSEIEKKLINKEIDVAFQVQKTQEREDMYFFSDLFRSAITTVVTVDDYVESYDELVKNDFKLAVISGYKYGDTIDQIPDGIKVFCKDQLEQLEMILDKKANFAVVDLGVFNYQLETSIDDNFKVLRHLDFDRPLHVVFNNKNLRDEFNDKLGAFNR
jgi:ABC-type amino acid transport substrate-binding protein